MLITSKGPTSSKIRTTDMNRKELIELLQKFQTNLKLMKTKHIQHETSYKTQINQLQKEIKQLYDQRNIELELDSEKRIKEREIMSKEIINLKLKINQLSSAQTTINQIKSQLKESNNQYNEMKAQYNHSKSMVQSLTNELDKNIKEIKLLKKKEQQQLDHEKNIQHDVIINDLKQQIQNDTIIKYNLQQECNKWKNSSTWS